MLTVMLLLLLIYSLSQTGLSFEDQDDDEILIIHPFKREGS